MAPIHVNGVEILRQESPSETLHINSKLCSSFEELLHDLKKIEPTLHHYHDIMNMNFLWHCDRADPQFM